MKQTSLAHKILNFIIHNMKKDKKITISSYWNFVFLLGYKNKMLKTDVIKEL